MTDVVFDTSVALKWFRDEGESEVRQARALLEAHRAGRGVIAWVLDLTAYELGNALVRRGASSAIPAVLDALVAACTPLVPDGDDRRLAADLAAPHGLTFYDASYAAVAQRRGAALATADRALLDAGLGETATALASRLGLTSG